jgi:hypothetical protein
LGVADLDADPWLFYLPITTNGCNFFPVRDAVHKKWWRNNRLDTQIQNKLAESLKAKFEDWEVALIIGPLSQ